MCNGFSISQACWFKLWVKQGIQLVWFNFHQCFFDCAQTLVNHINSNFDSSLCCTFAISCLQHIQFAFFNSELKVLHILIVFFQCFCNVQNLFVCFWHYLCQLVDCLWCSDTCNNVFALCIHQEFAVQFVFTCGWVSCKCNTCTTVVAHVTEYHGLYCYSCTPGRWDIVHTSVVDSTWVFPGGEYSFYCSQQLCAAVSWEIFADFSFIYCFKIVYCFFKIFHAELVVKLNASCFFDSIQCVVEIIFRNTHYNVREHLDKTAVCVICKSLVVCQCSQTFYNFIIKTKVENCVHHTRHRCSCTTSYRTEQWVCRVTEFFASDFFQLFQICKNLLLNFAGNIFAGFIVVCTSFCRDCEALWNRHTKAGHFGQVSTFTAQQLSH